jgi:hypothetical protein
MDDEQEQHPSAEPTLHLDASDAERRMLAQLARRRQLAASVAGRLSPRAGRMRGLALGGKRQFGVGLPLAVPHLLHLPNRLRREVDRGELQQFWWQRMAPNRAMLHRRRPLVRSSVTSALSPTTPLAEAPAGEAIDPVPPLDPPAPDLGSAATEGTAYHEDSASQAQQPARAEPTLVRTPAGGVASAVWQRLAAVLSPARLLAPRRNAPPAEVDRASVPAARPHAPTTSHSSPPHEVRSSAAADESALTPGESGIGAPAAPATVPQESGFSAPTASDTVPRESSYSEPTAAETEAENHRPATAGAVPEEVPLSPADEIAPLASRLTRRWVAPIGMIASGSQSARPSPTRLFWWPGSPTPAVPQPALPLPLGEGGGEGRASAEDAPPRQRSTPPAVSAPGLLGSVLEVHRAATTPTTRRVHFLQQVQHAERFATSGADASRWRVRSALTTLGAPTGEVHLPAGDETAEQPQTPQAQRLATILSPVHEPGGQHAQGDQPALPGRQEPARLPAPASPSAKANLRPPAHAARLLPIFEQVVVRLRCFARRTAAPPATPAESTADATLPAGGPRVGSVPVAEASSPALSTRAVHTEPSVIEPTAARGGALSDETRPPHATGLFQRIRRRMLEPPVAGQPPVYPVATARPVLALPVAPRPTPASLPHALPERPSDVSDTELTEVLRRLPAPMAAAALAAGVLGEAAGQAALERSGLAHRTRTPPPATPAQTSQTLHPGVLAPTASALRTAAFSPRPAQMGAAPAWPNRTLAAPGIRFYRADQEAVGDLRPERDASEPLLEAPDPNDGPAVGWSSVTQTAMGSALSPTAPYAMPERAWSTPLATQHAPLTPTQVPSPNPTGGGGAAFALAASGFSAAPLQRDVEPVAASGPSPAAHPATHTETHPTANAPVPEPKDLDHLAEEVLDKLRWRLAVERERLMG